MAQKLIKFCPSGEIFTKSGHTGCDPLKYFCLGPSYLLSKAFKLEAHMLLDRSVSIGMEHFSRRRWTILLAPSVSNPVHEGKHFLFQLWVDFFLSWFTSTVAHLLLLKFSMAGQHLKDRPNLGKRNFSLRFKRERDRVSIVGQRFGLWRVRVKLEEKRIHWRRHRLVDQNLDWGLVLASGALANPLLSIWARQNDND